jgi:hypothetical protein
MLSFRSFILEARRNSHLDIQKRENALQRLEKWSSMPDIHISYTKIRKIGINPKSDFMDTPLAVYAYPLKEIWKDIKEEGIRNVRFAANTSNYIFVLQERGKGLKDVSDYTRTDLDGDLRKIHDIVGSEMYNEVTADFGKMDNIKNSRPYKYLQKFIYKMSSRKKRQSSASHAAYISKILLELGYAGFSDKKGTGQIHPAEEIQSFFLTPISYKVVDIIEIKDIDVKDEDVRDMADYLRKNASKLSDDEIIKIVSKDFSLAKYMGPPRVKVLKVFMDKKQAERWKSKQPRIADDDMDYNGPDYVPAESAMHGTHILFNYSKLPEDLLSWGVSHPDSGVRISFVNWMKKNRYKPSNKFIKDNIKYNGELLFFVPSLSKETAKEYIKHHGYKYSLNEISSRMSERDFLSLMSEIKDFDISEISTYHEPVANFIYNEILAKKSPSDDDIAIVASYVQKGARTNPPMKIINGLKAKFPDYDFTQIGGWPFWRR